MTSGTTSVIGLDLGEFVADAVSCGYIQNSWYLINVEAGFELWQGGAGLATNSFSFSFNVSATSETSAQCDSRRQVRVRPWQCRFRQPEAGIRIRARCRIRSVGAREPAVHHVRVPASPVSRTRTAHQPDLSRLSVRTRRVPRQQPAPPWQRRYPAPPERWPLRGSRPHPGRRHRLSSVRHRPDRSRTAR